jgi:hypothetical protein
MVVPPVLLYQLSNLSLLAGLQDSHVLEESTPFATTIPLRQPLYQTSENS